MEGKNILLKGFISYSHKDLIYKNELLEHLVSIQKSFNIEFWHDGMIDVGDNISDVALANLKKSNIVILLISSAFIASNFCYNIELKNAIERDSCIIIPVMLKNTAITDDMPFAKIKSLPYDKKAISSFKPKNNGYVDVVNTIYELIKKNFPSNHIIKENEKINKENDIISKPNTENIINEYKLNLEIYQNGKLASYDIDQILLTSLMDTHNKMLKLISVLNEQNRENIKIYKESIENKKITLNTKKKLIRIFLMDLCYSIKAWIFSNYGVRVHLRVLIEGKYVCIMASDVKKEKAQGINWKDQLKIMSSDSSMIYYSGNLKAPLIKSLNINYHEEGNNDKTWPDYITCAFPNIDKNSPLPILSMGISVNKDYIDKYKNLLISLGILRIDLLIEDYINNYIKSCVEIDKTFNFVKIIKTY